MTLSELCIRRPVLTTLLTASIVAFGDTPRITHHSVALAGNATYPAKACSTLPTP